MAGQARCAIYDQRPEMCRRYPTVGDFIPSDCTYIINGTNDRQGECACGVGACCAIPRRGGEPEAMPLSEEEGGEPCKHLRFDEEIEKTSSDDSSPASGVAFGTRSLLRVLGQE